MKKMELNDYVPETINRLFERQAGRTPDHIALVCGDRRVTYRELNEEANRRAHFLISRGIGPEDFVGIVVDHTPEMIVDIFAVLKSGAGYIAMEPTFPPERINYIVEQAGIGLVFTQRKYADIFHRRDLLVFGDEPYGSYPGENPAGTNDGTHPIYVLYTSGTTGVPKGVVVEQRNVCNYVKAFQREFRLTEQDRMLQYSVCTFDIFTEELYPILLAGGTLVIAGEAEKNSIHRLVELIEREKITVISGFPYLLDELNRYRVPGVLRIAIAGGDVLRKEHVSRFPDRIAVYNTYGPTEGTVCASYYRYDRQDTASETIPIGKPVYGVEIWLLDEKLRKTTPGQIGEIGITGNGVTRGYLGRPEETRKNYIENPYKKGERMYLTGDLGRLRADGNIEFIRRKDEQVMIGGRRVEPLEVEHVLYRYPGIENAVVVSRLDPQGYPYLVAYYRADSGIDPAELKRHLGRYLPDFMIPEFFIKLDRIPKTESGKIDKRRLPVI